MDILTTIAQNMASVEGGTFLMGCADYPREQPVHRVTVADFAIGRYQVTQAQWMAVMGSNPSQNQESPEHPVDSVSWNMAQEFVHKLRELTGEKYRYARGHRFDSDILHIKSRSDAAFLFWGILSNAKFLRSTTTSV